MPPDDEETSEREGEPLSARAEAALAKARAAVAAAAGPKPSRSGRWLALVPVTIALIMMALMMPRATIPDAVPVPLVDERALERTMHLDDERAARARAERLPTDVLAVGSGVRALQAAQQREDPEVARAESITARAQLEEARRALPARPGWEEDLLSLRAVQMASFLEEVARYEATGEVTKDLEELGGGFVRQIDSSGWSAGRRIVLDEAQRRVAFKIVWNAIVGVEALERFKPTLDEHRALYTLYLTRPRASDLEQRSIAAMRRAAETPEGCERAAAEDRRAREAWRADKIRKLGVIDPSYPTSYALGVSYFKQGRYDQSVDAFRAFIDANPDGPLTSRAQNHLKAALIAYGTI